MINLDIIEREINELEARGETTYSLCERLAWLYVCRDHLLPAKKEASTPELYGSEFLVAASAVSYPDLMRILDEHMEALRVVQPRQYEAVLAKIREIK